MSVLNKAKFTVTSNNNYCVCNFSVEDVYLRPVFYGSSTVKPDRGVGISYHTVTRPPLAGPYGFSRIPRPVWDKPKVYLTEEIADTWLFSNSSTGYALYQSISFSIQSFLVDPTAKLQFIEELLAH